MKGILTRLETSPDSGHLRTNSIEGNFSVVPVAGVSFDMFGTPLTEGAHLRWIRTSTVKEVNQEEGKYIFKTLNSTYELQVMEETK